RRRLLVAAGGIMVLEIALLCLAPQGNPTLLFYLLLITRVLSGAAEAAASGADEALAYDSLQRAGRVEDWPRVLERQMRIQSLARIGAMSIGAAVYDPGLMQTVADGLGLRVTLTQSLTLRFPLFLTLVLAVGTLICALRMHEILPSESEDGSPPGPWWASIWQSLQVTFQAGRWILQTPFALVVIWFGLLFDGVLRMMLTMNSQYYRLIHLPEAAFGLIGAGMGLLGVFIPRLALKLVADRSPSFNLGLLSAMALLGMAGMSLFIPFIGLIPVVLLSSVMFLLQFFVSHYLNRLTSSRLRATVLSFKGLSFNLAYGLAGVMYSLLLALLREQESATGLPGGEGLLFIRSLAWFPVFFLLALAALIPLARRRLRGSRG
ncbi:MAG: MFS transporter, partial [Desulfobacterales bacterium]|nr:MFS transporter [Desulfobacterales bacterium]